MGQINIYRIESGKRNSFLEKIKEYFGDPVVKDIEENSTTYNLAFYYKADIDENELSWNWVFSTYQIPAPKTKPSPRGIVVITSENNTITYAVTFGMSFFIVDKFCDRDFGFDYACRVPYSNIKLTALTNPVSVRNKTINSYMNYDKLEFDSGESFAKIKGKFISPDDDDFLKNNIEVGTAIKFQLKTDSLKNIIKLVIHIETILASEKKIDIPRFSLVRDKNRIEHLQNNLIAAIENRLPQVIISEFGIIGSHEVFNRCDAYKLIYEQNEKEFSELTIQNITSFCEEFNITASAKRLSIKVCFIVDGQQRNCTDLLSILDFMDESERCLLVQGVWYEFNDDYLNYLKKSLSEIPVLYKPEFDLAQSKINAFCESKAQEEQYYAEYHGMSIEAVILKMKSKYYPERAFNEMRRLEGFVLGDRKTLKFGKNAIEVADLYKDDTVFSVKRGNASGDFAYVTDQSSMTVNAYKNHMLPNDFQIKKVVIWLIFERVTHFSLDNGTLRWDELNMLVLKNRLDQWKKEVRLAGLQPEIWINYQTK